MKSYGVTIQMKPGAIYFVCTSNFWVCGWNPMVLPFKWNLFSSTFTWCYLLLCSSNFWVCRRNPMVSPFKQYLFSSTFTYHYSLFCIFPKKFISARWYLFFRVLRKEVRFSVQLCSVGTLGKENDICIRFLRGGNKMIWTKKSSTPANA